MLRSQEIYLTPAERVAIVNIEMMVCSFGIGRSKNGGIHQQAIVHCTGDDAIIGLWRAWVPGHNSISCQTAGINTQLQSTIKMCKTDHCCVFPTSQHWDSIMQAALQGTSLFDLHACLCMYSLQQV